MINSDQIRDIGPLIQGGLPMEDPNHAVVAMQLHRDKLPHYQILILVDDGSSGTKLVLKQLMLRLQSQDQQCFWVSLNEKVSFEKFKSLHTLASEMSDYLIIHNIDYVAEIDRVIDYLLTQSQKIKTVVSVRTPLKIARDLSSVATIYECHSDPKEQDYADQKAKLRKLLADNSKPEAIQVFNAIADEMIKHGDFADIIELSNDLWKDLEWNALSARQKALGYAKRTEQCIEELEACLENPNNKIERAQIWLQLAKHHIILSRLDEAFRYLDRVTTDYADGDSWYVHALIEKARCMISNGDHGSVDFMQKAKIILETYHGKDDRLLAEWHFIFGFIKYRLGDLEASADNYLRAEVLFRACRMTGDELISTMNAAIVRYNSGQIESAIAEITRIEKMALLHSVPYVVEFTRRTLALHFYNQGKYSLSISKLNYLLPDAQKLKLNGRDIRIWYQFVLNKLSQRRYQEIKNLANILTASENAKVDEMFSSVHFFIGRLVDTYLSNSKYDIDELINGIRKLSIPDNMKLFLQSLIFEQNYLNLFPFKLNSQMDKLKLNCPQKIDMDHRLQHTIMRSIHLFLYGKQRLAQIELEKWTKIAQEVDFPLWEFRGLLWLAVIDLHLQLPEAAQQKLERAEELISGFESTWENDFFLVLKAIIFLHFGNREKFEETIFKVRPASPFVYFQKVLSRFLLSKKPPIRFKIDERTKDVFDDIIFKLHFKALKIFKVTTKENEKQYYGHELPKLNLSQKDIVLNHFRNELMIRGRRVDLEGHPLAKEFIAYLLSRIGEMCSKEDLIVHVWKERYNPLVHDQRIYTCVMRIRKMMGADLASIISVVDGAGYGISSRLKHCIISEYSPTDELPERQQWILSYLKSNKKISRNIVESSLKVSTSMAKRELKELVEKGFLQARGIGKNTEYRKPVLL